MRAFLALSARFLILPLCWFVGMACWNLHLLEQEDTGIHARSLALGDSHVVCDLDTAQIPGLQNIGSTAEPITLSLWKLRYVIAHHPVDTLILGLGPHNLCEKADRRLLDKGWATGELMLRLYAILPVDEAFDAPIHLPTYISTVFTQMCLSPKEPHLRYFDGFTGVRRRFKSNADSVLERHYFEADGTVAPFSETAGYALDSLLAMCEHQRIRVYVVGTPVHESYSTRIPSGFRTGYDSICKRASERGAVVLNHLNAFGGDSLFADADHLNRKGAKRFSRLIAEEIARGREPVQTDEESSTAN